MGGAVAFIRCGSSVAIVACFLACSPVAAQSTPDEAAAREYFERGRAAFDEADYEAALVYFRHAYRLSPRGELQYDIGVAASRLQREDEALEAFENYLEETDEPDREDEVRERIAALRRSIAERDATERALAEATIRYRTPTPPREPGRVSTSSIVGASVLGAVGIAGIATMSVALARDGTCSDAIAGQCVTERSATGWTYVYGGIGMAALAGGAAWLGVSAKRRKDRRRAEISISPSGFSWTRQF